MRPRCNAHAQRGSVLVNVGVGLSLLVILLGAIDLGLLFYYKREYQKAADLAAMAGSRELANGCAAAITAGIDNANTNLSNHEHDTPVIQPGVWKASTDPRFVASCGGDENAVRALIFGAVPTIFRGSQNISAEAIGLAGQRRAALNLRGTLVDVDTSQSVLLNSMFGGLLGGTVNVSAVGWDGLVKTDVTLLGYLDQLAIELGVQAGSYDQVLGTEASVGTLLDAAIGLLEQGGGTGDVSAAIGGLEALRLAIPAGTPLVALGDLIDVQTGTQASGLDTAVQLFQLVEAVVQAVNAENAAVADIDLGIASVKVKVLEPPKISAIGDPELARLDPDGPDRIYVRTAQVRTLISVNLPALSTVTGLVNAVLNLASPITTLLNSVLNLNLVAALTGLVGSLVGVPYEVTDIQVVPGNPRLDVSLDVGAGEAKVTDYNCSQSKELETDIQTSAADLRIGQMQTDPAQSGYVFGSDEPPNVGPVPLVDVGVKTCRVFLLLVPSCQARRSFEGGGIGLMGQTTVAGAPYTHTFIDPPDLDEAPEYETFATQNIVDSLAATLSGVQLQMYGPSGSGGLGGVLNLVGAAFTTVKSTLEPVITGVLSPLLDPLVNLLLDTLGLDLAQLEVGGRLSCGGEALLVE